MLILAASRVGASCCHSVTQAKCDAVLFTSHALAVAEGSDSTGVQERPRRGRSLFCRDLQSLVGKKACEIRGTRGLPLQFRTAVRHTHTLTTTKIHTYRARKSYCDTLLPFFRGCVCLSLELFIYLFFTLCKVKHFDRCWFFQR